MQIAKREMPSAAVVNIFISAIFYTRNSAVTAVGASTVSLVGFYDALIHMELLCADTLPQFSTGSTYTACLITSENDKAPMLPQLEC